MLGSYSLGIPLCPHPMPRTRATRIEVAVLAASLLIYAGVTAQSGTTTINLPLPSGPILVWGILMAIFGEVGRRILKRLDTVVESCSGLKQDFTEFKATINTALMGPDGQGGLLENDRETRRRLEQVEQGEYRHARKGDGATARAHSRADDVKEQP